MRSKLRSMALVKVAALLCLVAVAPAYLLAYEYVGPPAAQILVIGLVVGVGALVLSTHRVLTRGLYHLNVQQRRTRRALARHDALTAQASEDSAARQADSVDQLARITEQITRTQDLLERIARTQAATDDRHAFEIAWLRGQSGRLQGRSAPGSSQDAGGAWTRDAAVELTLLSESVLFDSSWYSDQYPGAEQEPTRHYLEVGASRGYDPHPLFDTKWYVREYPQSLVDWHTPLGHFLAAGADQGCDPHPLFDTAWYVEKLPDAAMPGTNPLVHYLQDGASRGADPNPFFDTDWYAGQYADTVPTDVNPLVHFVVEGAAQGCDPIAGFDVLEYKRRFPESGNSNPLVHFLTKNRGAGSRQAITPAAPVSAADAEPDEFLLKLEYLDKHLHREADTFVLYRIIGNDLPPRHESGQSLINLRFILENEPEHPGLEKRWVLNRIIDPNLEEQLARLLEEYGKPFLHVPFKQDEYARVPWSFDGLTQPEFLYIHAFEQLDPAQRERAIDHTYHYKNLYVMNNNGARNLALEAGRSTGAKWVLPWDGNCFLTASAWAALREHVGQNPHLKYFVVPMARVPSNEDLLDERCEPEPDEEPQLLFRRDAAERFNEQLRYGRRPKVELFYRLGIPGPWDNWKLDPWETPTSERSSEAGQFGTAGWVARLSSGRVPLESDIRQRGVARLQGIRTFLDSVDELVLDSSFDPQSLTAYDEPALQAVKEAHAASTGRSSPPLDTVLSWADKALARGPYTVVDKKTLPPSGDPHDYWHPAPYWWPNPDTPDGLPYVRRDGQRVPGTQMYEPGSDQYDRTRLQMMYDDVTSLALAWYVTGDHRYAEHAAALLRTWFVAPETRMNPHLEYAQARRGHDGDRGTRTGVIETKDLYYVLDAVRLIDRSGALPREEVEELARWFRAFLTWLLDSDQGQQEARAKNNHGTAYDLQVGALAAYLADHRTMIETYKRAQHRIEQQFEPDGAQPNELERSLSAHYCAFNLQLWVSLARQAAACGSDLWAYESKDGRSLERGLMWLLPHWNRPWPYRQIEKFDQDRLLVLYHWAKGPYPWLKDSIQDPPPPGEVPAVFSPHDGIRLHWALDLEEVRQVLRERGRTGGKYGLGMQAT